MTTTTMRVFRTVLVAAFQLTALRLSAQTTPTDQQLQVSLRSPDPLTRAGAFDALRHRRGALSAPNMGSLLAETLERENDLIASTWQQSGGTQGIVDKYGEGFGEYVSELAEECWNRCDRTDPAVASALAEAFPGASAQFHVLAGTVGAQILPSLFVRARQPDLTTQLTAITKIGVIDAVSPQLAAANRSAADSVLLAGLSAPDDDIGIRATAARLVGEIVDRGIAMSPARRSALHSAVARLTTSPDEMNRIEAVRALGKFRDPGDLPALRRIGEQDTATIRRSGQLRYPVREEALRAQSLIRTPH